VRLIAPALIGLILLASGCAPEQGAADPEAETLKFAVVPAGDTDRMIADFGRVAEAVAKEVGMKAEVVEATDYGAVIEDLARGGVDIAWFGPASYFFAKEEAGAQAFAVGESEEGGTAYHSICLVPAGSPIRSLEDLKGRTVALVDPASTSGSIVPTGLILEKFGQLPDQLFGQVVYAGSHDAAFERMLQKQVDACFCQDITLKERLEEGKIKESDVRIIETSDPIPGSPLCLREGLEPELAEKIKAAFIGLEESGVSLKVQGQGDFVRFVATDDKPYEGIFSAIKAQKLKRDELLK
jgi:phosphonate transport system substrate-binding protein